MDALNSLPKDNFFAFAIWAVILVVGIAFVTLFFGFKQVLRGGKVSKSSKNMLPFVKWPLLFASAGFNIFFTYYVFLPSGVAIAAGTAGVMGGVNLAEAYLVRLVIATWRHELTVIFKLALVFTIPVFLYSLMAAGSSFSTMMNKNNDSQIASQLKVDAAKDRILLAEAKVKQAEISNAQDIKVINTLNTAPVKNTYGATVNFRDINKSCLRQGYYAQNYPALCAQYQRALNGGNTLTSVAQARSNALAESSEQKIAMAEIIDDRPPEILPVLLGFTLGIAAVGFIVSLALESAIVGVGFFEELFVKPTPLPALVKFANKDIDWETEDTDTTLRVDVSPSPGTVGIVDASGDNKPFSVAALPQEKPSTDPDPDPDPKPSAEGKPVSEGEPSVKPSAEGGDLSEAYFSEWLQLVKEEKERPTVKPTVRWISKKQIVDGIKSIEAEANIWLDRAFDLGAIKEHPKPGAGKAKYVHLSFKQ